MTVGLMLDEHLWFEIGSGDFLHCFFSTISYRLEPNGWGSKYPFMMKKLYHEDMEKKYNLQLLEEVRAIHKELEFYSADDVVWDIDDLSKQPPWGAINDDSITSLANYFSTDSGADLFDLFYTALNMAIEYDYDVKIMSTHDFHKLRQGS